MVDLRLRHIGSLLCRIDDGSNRRIVHLLRQGPLEAVRLRAGGHRPYRCGGAPARERCVPDTHPHRPLPKYFSVLDHSSFLSLDGHRRPFGTQVNSRKGSGGGKSLRLSATRGMSIGDARNHHRTSAQEATDLVLNRKYTREEACRLLGGRSSRTSRISAVNSAIRTPTPSRSS